METLALLDDPSLIRDFLGVVMVKDVSVDPGQSLVPICQSHGWGTFQRELLTLMESTNLETMERNVRLLEPICLAKPGKKKRAGTNFARSWRRHSSWPLKRSMRSRYRPIGVRGKWSERMSLPDWRER